MIADRGLELVLINIKKRTCLIVKNKESKKRDKYLYLARELRKL